MGADDARDVTQEALLKAWRSLDQLRRRDDARPWLHAIVVNESRQLLRNRRRRPQLAEVEPAAEFSPGLVTPDISAQVADRDRLDRAFVQLDADQRAALALHYVTDLSVPQVAVALGVREGTVKSRIHAAVQRMRTELEQQDRRG